MATSSARRVSFCTTLMLLCFFFNHIILKQTYASSCLIFPEYDAMMFGSIRMEIYQSRCVATASCEIWGPSVGIHMLSALCVFHNRALWPTAAALNASENVRKSTPFRIQTLPISTRLSRCEAQACPPEARFAFKYLLCLHLLAIRRRG